MSTSAHTNLPPEIIEAILRLLPVKSLGRFKSVSKKWNTLISSPQFIKTHLRQTTKLILTSDTKSLYSLHLNTDDLSATGKELCLGSPDSPPSRWEQILGSCNGLVLAIDEVDKIFITNPTTKEVWEVPRSPFALPEDESFVMYGFGYDSANVDYKIVSISFWDTDNEHNPDCTDMFVSVYGLLNNCWRKLDNSPYDHAVGHLTSGVLVNEKLHWLTSTRPGYASTICAFSLENEGFVEIELPDSIDNGKAVFNELVVVGEKLGLFVGNDLWVMEEYGVGGSWTRVCIDGVEVDPVKPVCLVEGSDGDIVLGGEDEVVVYNIDESRCRNVVIEGGPSGFAVGGTYFESLESPKCIIRTLVCTLKMDDIFLNPFSDMYAFSGNSGDDVTSRNNNENSSNAKKRFSDALEIESAFGTYNKPPKLMAIEDYSRWARKFEDWLMAFAFQSWKNLKNGYNSGGKKGEMLSTTEEIDSFVAEQKCVALLFQSVREHIISLIDYSSSKDLWEKLEKKCIGSEEIKKNKKKLLRKEFDMFGCLKNESVCKMIERFGHLKLELARHGITYPDDELVDKLFDSLSDEMDWRYYALMLKNTIAPEKLNPDLVIEKLESHELELKKTYKFNHSSYKQNLDLYYPKSMMSKATYPKTAFSAENVSTGSKESQSGQSSESHSGYHSGSSSSGSHSDAKNRFQCNIAIDLKNAQNFDEESAKQQMVFLASVLESYEGLVAGKIGNTNLTKEDYDMIDPEEMELIDIRWAMASAVRRAQRFMEITGRKTIGGPSTKLGFDKSKVTCFKCKQKGHFKRECRNAYADESENPFRDDYYKKAIYHQNKSEPPRLKQSEDIREKSRALAVIYDNEGYDWSQEVLPEEDAVGYAFMAKNEPIPWKDSRNEEQKYKYRRMLAENRITWISGIYLEAKRARRWDPNRECYLDPYGNIAIDHNTLDIEAIINEFKIEDDYWQNKWWGTGDDKEKEEKEKREKEENEKS
ncbi:putative transcription factor interactor and regulator CCHC(Zn) family [Helianthus annuus]|nr:putative transcription factor interactor and regulator CCHC(Zn) family [Helianthus annuus]KAJ0707538.1 putative transcription factor interactor and regulator CCHC(Zn) family [Helianthus annuus]KAJ0888324.1 putative transcription factor interactor and regulator CCHC(Zn) family [Helianthus annuus]